MKRGILSIAVLLVTVIGMAQFTDDFSDGDLSNAPAWSGDAVNFEVLAGELHLNAPMVEDTSISR
jgi:spermidine/putrescine-binding protein